MAVDPRELPLADLRRRYLDEGGRVTRALLEALRSDARAGARQLAETLERRRAREREAARKRAAMFALERGLWERGLTRVAGVDEVGLGPLAGPVVAAAVVFEPELAIDGVDDSKVLEAPEREALAAEIRARAVAVGVGEVPPREVDRLNVHRAGLVAMHRAVEALGLEPQHVLVDARTIPDLFVPQSAHVKGDARSFTIAAASIVAKVHRDALMVALDAEHPQYGFASHKGYCTAEHQDALRRHGPSPVHRMSYPVLRELMGECSAPFYELRAHVDAVVTAEDCAALDEELRARRAELAEEELRKLRALLQRRLRAAGGGALPRARSGGTLWEP
jgi:ribonuclease HII